MMRFVAGVRWAVRAKDAGSVHMRFIWARLRTQARAVQRGPEAQGSLCWSLSKSAAGGGRGACLERVLLAARPRQDLLHLQKVVRSPLDCRQEVRHRRDLLALLLEEPVQELLAD